MFHTSGLKGVVQYVFKSIQQKHIPLTNFVVFGNVTLIVVFGRGRCNIFSGKISNELAHRLSILDTTCLQIYTDDKLTIGKSVYSKQFQVTNSKYKQQSSTHFNTCM